MRRGFTLVEIMAGTALLSILMGVIASAFGIVNNTVSLSAARADIDAQARFATDRLERDLLGCLEADLKKMNFKTVTASGVQAVSYRLKETGRGPRSGRKIWALMRDDEEVARGVTAFEREGTRITLTIVDAGEREERTFSREFRIPCGSR